MNTIFEFAKEHKGAIVKTVLLGLASVGVVTLATKLEREDEEALEFLEEEEAYTIDEIEEGEEEFEEETTEE